MLLVNHVTTSWEPVTAGCGFGTLNTCNRCLNKPSSKVFKHSLPLGTFKSNTYQVIAAASQNYIDQLPFSSPNLNLFR